MSIAFFLGKTGLSQVKPTFVVVDAVEVEEVLEPFSSYFLDDQAVVGVADFCLDKSWHTV